MINVSEKTPDLGAAQTKQDTQTENTKSKLLSLCYRKRGTLLPKKTTNSPLFDQKPSPRAPPPGEPALPLLLEEQHSLSSPYPSPL
jgi:hypothetical protein